MAAAVVVTGCATAQPAPPSLVADPPLTDDGRAPGAGQADLDRGIAYIEKEAWDKALPYLDAALEAKPDNAEAHYYRALAQARLGNAEAAETGFEKAIELNPELTLARAHLGELYLTSQPPRAQKAIEVLTPAVEAEPKAADLHQLLGFAYRMEKNYKEASKHYQASLAAEDNADVRFDFADMLFEAGELDEAAAQMRLVLPKFKTDKAIVAQLAHRFAKAKAYDDCVEAFTVAIGLDQKEPGFFLHRGLCQHSLQKEEKARVDYKKAIDLDAKFQPGWYYMGMSWLGDNKRTQALDAFEKAWRIDKESAIGKAAKEKLDEVRKSR
ncbi:MAG: tetratricopeptide repeat protein [Myxococcales bacterium]|nr:tetratricopeptide repeat protein [Myxococcales bacterium]